MIAYKLFRKRKDGTYGPLFINKRQKLERNVVYEAEEHRTKGYAYRPGWHCCGSTLHAPHLSKKGRVWCMVEIGDFKEIPRPESQGGKWYLANRMRIMTEMGGTYD